MKSLWIVLTISCILSPSFVRSELYSALSELDALLETQRDIVNFLEDRVSTIESRLAKIKKKKEFSFLILAAHIKCDQNDHKSQSDNRGGGVSPSSVPEIQVYFRYQDDYKSLLQVSSNNFSQFISNPINAFILIKKLSVDWTDAKSLLFEQDTKASEDFNNTLFPDKYDLLGAVEALLRLQETYNIEISTLEKGELDGATAAFKFSIDDCFEMGRQAFVSGYYDYALLWLERTYQKLIQHDNTSSSKATIEEVLKYVKLTTFEKGKSSALAFVQSLFQFGQKPALPSKAGIVPQQRNASIPYNMYTDPKDLAVYQNLCKGGKQDHSKKHLPQHLKCKFESCHPYLKFQPVKEEQLWLHPKISMYYNVISDKEIDALKALARPILERAEVAEFRGEFSHRVSETRVTKIAWLQRQEHPIVNLIYHRIEYVTGLFTESAEDFQIANYGLGGHFHLHLDVLPNSESYFGAELGNRIATWLTYLSDVDAGGATVFPRLNLTVQPRKGSALFWYNIKSNGIGDFLTLHGACPVVTGSKWVSNVWLHERGQEFRLRCGKDFDSPLVFEKRC